MSGRVLILRDSNTKIVMHEEYLEIRTILGAYRVAFRHLATVYLNKAIEVDIGTCYAISQKVPLYLIDEHGYILAQLLEAEDA